jgi:hypothetical protein
MANSYGFDPVAWSVDGGRHRGELLRVLAYGATGGGEGIISAPDCKVHQLSTPGGQIEIDPGALLIRNRSANVRNQTYVANGRTPTRLDVTPTGGSGRRDMVVVRVEDPQYTPWPQPAPAQAPDHQYVKPYIIENVPAGIETFAELNLGYSAVELALLNIPAGTQTITNGMITDLRDIAQPRRQRYVSSWVPPSPPSQFPNFGLNNRGLFPSMALPVKCPSWATQIKLMVTVNGVLFWSDTQTKIFTGNMRAEYGWTLPGNPYVFTPPVGLHFDDPKSLFRSSVQMAGQMALPANFRGKTHNVRIGTMITFGTGAPIVDAYSNVVVDAEFVEVPE